MTCKERKKMLTAVVGMQQASLMLPYPKHDWRRNQNGVSVGSDVPWINKRLNRDKRKQVEWEACFWARTATLRLQPPTTPIPLNFTVHHFNQSLPGPPPSRLSLTDGLFNWRWGSGAHPPSRDVLLGTATASLERAGFCPARYGKTASVPQPDKHVSFIRSSFCPE